jgi:hypothetical protein
MFGGRGFQHSRHIYTYGYKMIINGAGGEWRVHVARPKTEQMWSNKYV